MGLTLNQLLEAALLDGQASAMQKLAEDAEGEATCKVCGRPALPGTTLCKEHADTAARKEENNSSQEAGGTEKTSSARVEKLASAVDYIAHTLTMGGVTGRIKTAQPEGQTQGIGIGPNTLDNNMEGMTSELMPERIGGSGATSVSIPTSPPQEAGANPKAAKSSMGTDAQQRPGGNEAPGSGLLGSKPGVMVQPGGAGATQIKEAMLRKLSADSESVNDGTAASISAPKTSALPEDRPSPVVRPAEVTSQERMIASNEAAIDFTKRDAKAVPKKRMGEVLDEPAQSKAGDSALHDALGSDVVAQAGAKYASVKRLMQKVASQGCTCGSSSTNGTCDYCRVTSRMEKIAQRRVGVAARSSQGTSGLAR